EIVAMYGETSEVENVKVFDNEEFGYYRVTVERPLRLNFQITEERINQLDDERAFQNLAKSRKKGEAKEAEIEKGKEQQATIKRVLMEMKNDIVYTKRDAFIELIKDAFKETDINLRAPLIKENWTALSERDATEEPSRKVKNKIEADSELRDTEIIPLSENIEDYF